MIVFNGCSFTKYFWPTWADMLCYGYTDRINLGNMGSGNEYIFLTTYPYLEKADKVCIQWSGYNRFDFCKNGNWNIDGNITNNNLGNWDKAKWFYDDDHFQHKSKTIQAAFSDLVKYHNIQSHYMYLEDLMMQVKDNTYTFKTTPNTFVKKKNFKDGHPDVFLQFEIAKKIAHALDIDFYKSLIEQKLPDLHNQLVKVDHLQEIWNNNITLETK